MPPGSSTRASSSDEQELLAGRQVRHLDVDAAVREHARFDREIELTLEVAREELAADGVAHVVRQQHDGLEPRVAGDLRGLIGVPADAVADVGLGGEPEAEEVEQHDAAFSAERREHGPPVERTRGEPVQDEERRAPGVALGRDVEHEGVEPVDRDDATTRLPFGDGAGGSSVTGRRLRT